MHARGRFVYYYKIIKNDENELYKVQMESFGDATG